MTSNLDDVILDIVELERTDQEIMELDPEDLTLGELIDFSIKNVLLVSELTSLLGVGRVHKDLLKLLEKYKEESK